MLTALRLLECFLFVQLFRFQGTFFAEQKRMCYYKNCVVLRRTATMQRSFVIIMRFRADYESFHSGKTQLSDADAAFEGGHIGFRTIDLVDSHAVADEIEHVLGASSGEGGEGDEEKGRCEQDSFHKICLAAALRPGFKIQRKPAASWFQRSLWLLARWSWRLFEDFGGYERI